MFRIKPAAETDSDADADTALAGECLRYEPVNTMEVAEVLVSLDVRLMLSAH